MQISVITPSYQQGRFIRDCIESVRAQQGVEIEHIVVDACSTDETVDVLRGYPHLHWVSEPDRGQTDAINKGFRRATGDWLMWLNADDYLTEGALLSVSQFATQHPAARLIYGDCDFVDEIGAVVGHKSEPYFSFKMLLFYGTFVPSTATFFHRSLVTGPQPLDPSLRVCMDFEFYLRLAAEGVQFHHLPLTVACFRWHGANVSRVHTALAKTEFRQLQRHYLRKTGSRIPGNEMVFLTIQNLYRALRWWRRHGPRGRITWQYPGPGERIGWWHRPNDGRSACR